MANDKGYLVCKWDEYNDFFTNEDIYDSFEDSHKHYKLYHYTNLKVLDALLCNCTFWASHISYLNDPKECESGTEIDARGSNYAGLFTISFSQESDSLHQWITYAKESGVAIELDYDLLCDYYGLQKKDWYCIDSLKRGKEGEKIKFSEQIGIKLQSIIYEVNYENKADPEIGEIDNNVFRKLWQAAYKKRNSYESENEIRLAVFATMKQKGDDKQISDIKYFCLPEKHILRPYLELTFGYNVVENEDRVFTPCLPVKSITVGPSGIQQTIFDSVVHRIKYGKCEIYNYLEDKQKFVKNFSCYLIEIYCKEANIYENNFYFEFGEWAYNNEVTLCENIFNALNSLNLKQKENQGKCSAQTKDFREWISKDNNKNLISALISNWIKENRTSLSDYKIETCVETGDEFKEKLDDLNQNFYFSKEGILIRKSKIPYIF